jgi:hypothetical protein
MLTMTTAPKFGHTLRAGQLAFLDTFAGLVPCKVRTLVLDDDSPAGVLRWTVTVKLTATRGAYKRGEVLTFAGDDGRNVVPRSAVYVRNYKFRIAGPIVPVVD